MKGARLWRLHSIPFHFYDLREKENCRGRTQISGVSGSRSLGRSWLQRGSLPLYFWGGIGTILHLDGGVVILYAFIRKAERPIKRLLHCLVRKWLWLWLVDWRQVDRFQDLSGGRSTGLGVWQKHGVGKRSWSFIMSHFLICVPRSAVEPFAGSSNIC